MLASQKLLHTAINVDSIYVKENITLSTVLVPSLPTACYLREHKFN